VPGVLIHVLGAHGLHAGRPVEIPWPIPFALAAAAALLPLTRLRRRYAMVAMAMTAALLLAASLALEMQGVWITVAPALLVLAGALAAETWQGYREFYHAQARMNPFSGLPNLAALVEEAETASAALVVARIRNIAEIHASLAPEQARALAGQIGQRFSLGSATPRIFQGDEGIFAWFHHGTLDELPGHLDALHAICRAPVTVANRRIDLHVAFGADVDIDRALPNRLASALMAADQSDQSGDRWTIHRSGGGEDANWRLSLLGQLDEALETGAIWVAYQPQLTLASGRIGSAEALVRWSHPERGNIPPNDFISAAERGGRIGSLTYFVLERALADVRVLNERGYPFAISVNLSPLLLSEPDLLARIRALLARHATPPDRLTLEITETEKIVDNRRAIAVLSDLRAAGIGISIDDYGTGRSTLEYLRDIPADEVKIDQAFVRGLSRNPGDRLMVESTIALAHSLGHRVVAEGVEDEAALQILAAARCDLVQGYHLARPMPFAALARQLLEEKSIKAA